MYGNPQGLGTVNVAMSNYAQTFAQADYVANLLAPIVPVQRRSNQYLIFDRANSRLVPTLRKPAGAPVQLSMNYATDKYYCDAYAAEVALPRETQAVAEQLGYIATKKATQQVMDAIFLGREAQVVGALKNNVTNISTPSNANLWDTNGSDPVAQIEALRYQILLSGKKANTLVLGPDMYKAARLNAAVIEKFKYVDGGVITAQQLAMAFGVDKVIEANVIQTDGNDVATFMWAGIAALAYVQPVTDEQDISPLKTFVDVTQGVEGYEVLEFPDAHASKKVDYISAEMAYSVKVTAQPTIGVIQHGTAGN